MRNLTGLLGKVVVPLAVLALVVAAGLTLVRDDRVKSLTAHFPRTVSIYEGSDVRVLGVPVGRVESVEPRGTDVEVTMTYDAEVKVPADAKALIVSPSVVGDRYIQLAPAYEGGDVLQSGAVLEEDRTAVPLELDEIYGNLDRLVVALGPDGANSEGALSDLLETTAANFGGQGQQFHRTIKDFGKLSATLDDNKEALFDSAAQLEAFVSTLAENDRTVRDFNASLSSASTVLAGEREELAAALRHLGVALGEVNTFVKDNRQGLSRNIRGLNRIAKLLVKQRAALEETLRVAPTAAMNLHHAYNPQAGTLDTNANIGNLADEVTSDPGLVLCSFLSANDHSGEMCDLVRSVLPRGATFGAGSGSSIGQRSDPTLGGLVGAAR